MHGDDRDTPPLEGQPSAHAQTVDLAGSTAPDPPPSVGAQTVDVGPFTVEALIGRGGMATVWRGRHRASGTPVAIKIVHGSLAREPRYRVAFAREVRAVARLDHRAIVRVFDHGALQASAADALELPTGAPYLVMQRLDGGPLLGSTARPWPAVRAMLETVLEALAHAHARDVVHRDLKPDNILLGPAGPVITDFGLAWRPGRATADAAGAGTPGYMAPEQIRGDWLRFGPPTDLYAVGCIAWQALCGEPPHGGPGRPPLAVAMAHVNQPLPPFVPRVDVPDGVEGWLRRMLAPTPEARFAFAAEALTALRGLGGGAATVRLPAAWQTGETPVRMADLIGVGRALFGHRIWPPVGREACRDRLWAALGQMLRSGEPRGVVLEGPSGFGKTHLADWLAERAHRAGVARVMRASHADQGPDGGPSGGLGPMLARFIGAPRADVQRALPAIRARVPADQPQRAIEIAALASADGVCRDGDVEVRLDRAGRIALFPEALAALAAERPLVVILDDVQWGLSTLRAIAPVFEAAALPVLVIMTLRTDALERAAGERLAALARHPAVERLSIGPLAPEAHRQVIRAMLPVHDSLVEALAERAAGSPLFAVELLRYFIAADLLVEDADGYRLSQASGRALPAQLQVVWQVRLAEALGGFVEQAWPSLEVAAALGLDIDDALWRAVCARAGVPIVDAAIERLLDAGLARPAGEGRWALCHAMLRETLIAASREAGRWPGLNRACAEALATGDVEPLRLAEHWIAAGEHAAALEPLDRATTQILLDAEPGPLARIVTRRIALLRRIGAGRHDARWQKIRLHVARLAKLRGQYQRALRHTRRVQRIARRDGDLHSLSRALFIEGDSLYYLQGPRPCIEVHRVGLAVARQLGDRALLAGHLIDIASTLTFIGRLDEAEAALGEAWQNLGDRPAPRRRGTVQYYLAGLESYRENHEAGIARCRAARAAFRTVASRHLEAVTWSVEGDLERRAGQLDRAARCYADFNAQVSAGGPAARAYVALNGALLDLARGLYETALEKLALAGADDISTQRAVLAACRLACAGGRGDWAMWDAIGLHLLDLLEDAPLSPDVPWAADIAALHAEAAGHAERAAFARRVAADHRRRLRGQP